MSLSQQKIEQLLEQMGSVEPSQETQHRYQLRRQLLSSRFFHKSHQRNRWNLFFSYAAPLMAGSMVVVMFIVLTPVTTSQAVPVTSGLTVLGTSTSSYVALADASASNDGFFSGVNAPVVTLADFNTEKAVRFVPLHSQPAVRVR